MSKLIRLDKFLADMSVGTRSEVKLLINKGKVKVNNNVVKDASLKIDKDNDFVEADGLSVSYTVYEYYMLNKPAGVVSATEDKNDKTVLDIIDTKKRKDLFPVGRLDKDTEGLLLITNDGTLSHNLLSPKKHVEKTYYVKTDKKIPKEDEVRMQEGLDIGEDKLTMPAKLSVLDDGYLLTIKEGKYHQVKRMFKACGATVTYLKRLSMGPLKLDESLKPGEYRPLTKQETKLLYGEKND